MMPYKDNANVLAEYALENLSYDPKTGTMMWIGTRMAGKRAGCVTGKGYREVNLQRKKVAEHRIAYLIMTGSWPEMFIDHINGDKTDNRWENLRHVPHIINARNMRRYANNTSGVSGVHWRERDKRWIASINDYSTGRMRKVQLGQFPNIEAAIDARKRAEAERGYSERHGK